MLREYVDLLYAPAAGASRAMNDSYQGAAALASWKQRVRAGWADVRVDHVDSYGVSEAPEIGGAMDLQVYVSLGELSPDDVEVEVVHGRVRGEDDLVDPQRQSLVLAETYEGGRHRFDGRVRLDRTGPFGYTVRALPRHAGLASPAELGLVAVAD
jgi:starch phosphorylase